MNKIEPLSDEQVIAYGIPSDVAQAYNVRLCTHIAYVQEACKLLDMPYSQIVAHDNSKWSMEEFPAYAMKFCYKPKDDEEKLAIEDNFAVAWLHHENLNPHHWGHWIPRTGKYVNIPLPMPDNYVKEMVADWLGAGKAYNGSWNIAGWLNTNGVRFNLHPETISLINQNMARIGYRKTHNHTWSFTL